MDNFSKAVKIVLEHEGVLSDHPEDNGGFTKYGISKKAFPKLDIRSLTKEQAIAIYKEHYWDRCKCGQMPWWAALVVFDCAVNQGPDTAEVLLQRAVGAKPDGIIGPRTLAAVAKADPQQAVAQFMSRRVLLYANLSDFQHFGRGWMVRLFAITLATETEK